MGRDHGADARSQSRSRRFALRAAALYVAFGAAWVLVGDRLLEVHATGTAHYVLSTLKGLSFVAVSALIVFASIRAFGRASERAEAEARASEAARQASEGRYRALVERVPGVVYLNAVDPADHSLTRCVYIGPQIRDLLGIEPEEWIRDDGLWLDVIHPDDRDEVFRLNELADGLGEFRSEYRALHRDGSVVWVHDEAVCVRGDDGAPLYWQGLMLDITAQRMADAAVHGLAESLRGVFTASPLPIVVLEVDGRVRHWNRAAERVFGWTSAEVVGRLLPFVPQDRRDEHVALRERVLAGEAFSGVDVQRVRKDGSPIWVSLSVAPLHDAEGRVESLMAVLEDVTERRRTRNELAEQAEMLASVSDAIVAADLAMRITYWNPGAEALYGWSAEEVRGRDVRNLLQVPGTPDAFADAHRVSRSGGWRGERLHGRKDGSRVPVDVRAIERTGADGGATYLAVIRDVSERRTAQEVMDRRARQQEAVSALGLAALAATDLQALLDEAARVVASTLEVSLSSLMELLPDGERFLLRAGVGWNDGIVGEFTVDAREGSLAAFAMRSGEAVVVDDLASERRFTVTKNLVTHHVVSGAATVVYGRTEPFGVLQAFESAPREFNRDDIRFLQGVSAVIGLAIERARVDQALEETRARYRSLVERGPGIVYLHDLGSIPSAVTYMSPQVLDHLGYPPERWTRDPAFRFAVVHPADRDSLVRAERLAVENDGDLDLEYRIVRADGDEVWVHDHATVIRDSGGDALYRQGLLVDVTDRHRAEEERQHALHRQLRLATRLELLHRIDRDVLDAAPLTEMAGHALDHLRLLVRYDRASVLLVDPPTGGLAELATRSARSADSAPRDVVSSKATRELLSRESLLVDDLEQVETSSPYLELARADATRSLISISLAVEGGRVGALLLTALSPRAFNDEALDIAREAAAELATAIGHIRLRQQLGERAEQLARLADERQQMLRRIVSAQEEERERVALELHDGLGQILTSVSLFASDLQEEVPPVARPRAARVHELARRAIVDSRRLVWSLRPPELERLGLVPALRRLAEDSATLETTVDLHEEIGDLRLGPESEAVVYRVVQEAIHNAQKHARASAISILVGRRNGVVSTIVEDNGRGFDLNRVPTGRGLGLIGMRERAELVDGELVVESAADAGTRVRLEVPVASGERPIDD